MRNTVITTLLLSIFCLGAFAQSVDWNQPLPKGDKIKKGVLPNGMTYYLKKSGAVENAASYYIIQNVGSILENDDQQGLAHFLEHMAFNGTEHFPGKGILNTLQKHGAIFGKDINAYTSFDETVYNLNNIPNKEGLVDTCLLVLRDWSNYLLLTDEEIDAERGVIKEEWRTRQNGQMRIWEQTLPIAVNYSKYASRSPIGKMDVVENFDYKVLRDFYHDWYRTELQAIAIIGDIDVDEMENKIKKLFSPIPAVENPRARYTVDIPNNDELLFVMATDKEVSTSNISFHIKHPKVSMKTLGDYKSLLLSGIATSILSERLSDIAQKSDAPFLGAYVYYGSNLGTTDALGIGISPKPNEQYKAFQKVLQEVNRAAKFGFTLEEINRVRLDYVSQMENAIKEQDDMPHRAIIGEIKENYLRGVPMLNIEEEDKIIKEIFATLKPEEVHQKFKSFYTPTNRYITVTGIEGEENLTQAQAEKLIEEVENDATLEAHKDAFGGKTLLSGVDITPGKVVSEKWNKAIESTTFALSNGIKVHYKFTDKNKNQVSLSATSDGGLSLLQDADYPSASSISRLVQYSGLGNYSATDLQKVLTGKTAGDNIRVSDLSESVNGYSNTKDVETMLQLVYLRFVKPRFDPEGYQVMMEGMKKSLLSRSKSVQAKIQDSVTVAIYGKNLRKRLFDEAYLKDISFEKIKALYLERFKDASDFEFFVVGDVTKENLKPLLEQYIASIPTDKTKEKWKDNSVAWVADVIDRDVYIPMETPKSTVIIGYKNKFKYSLKNKLLAKALGDILDLRYTETLREEEGGTYGASAWCSVSKKPKKQATIQVYFDCNPDKVEKLVGIVKKEIEKIAQGEILQKDLEKTTTNFLKERKQYKKNENGYEMSLLQNYFIEGYNMNDPKNFEQIVEGITAKDLQAFTAQLLKKAKSYQVVIKPPKKS